jgi:hypothetical protein
MRGVARSEGEVKEALRLVGLGLSDYEIGRQLGIPRSTVLNWRHGVLPNRPSGVATCNSCGGPGHDRAALDAVAYGYLLGQYLGDGCIFRIGRGSFGLRISSDAAYAGIIRECSRAIQAVRGRKPYVYRYRDRRLATITSGWTAWPCLIPQHGPGRKHERTIALASWQVELVESDPRHFIRGLIHSDGWRGMNRVHVKGRDYEYSRYQFSNRSHDIRQLFVYACELLGIATRPWGRWHVSVARRESVALLDEFVGPKS